MKTETIVSLFNGYITAFKAYQLNDVAACYHLPCTLHTPDKVVLLKDLSTCFDEFNDIFTQLQQGEISNIIAKNASYSVISDSVLLASIDWVFVDSQGEIFADFCAIYHLVLIDNQLKIFNVVSHELSNSLSLNVPFVLND